MRIKRLSELKRAESQEIPLGRLPEEIYIAHYATAKAFKINELIRTIHKDSYEWYGYTLASRENPELILDIGLPENQQNLYDYTSIHPEYIFAYQQSLAADSIINGWIHSHGQLDYRHFSETDEKNQVTVLDYVTSLLRKPVAKKQILIQDLVLLQKDHYTDKDLQKGSVSVITDAPVSEAVIMETIFGGFCYAVVIGDEGWHRQEIHYKKRGILSGETSVTRKEGDMVLVDTGRMLTDVEVNALGEEVERKIQPISSPPPETIERM